MNSGNSRKNLRAAIGLMGLALAFSGCRDRDLLYQVDLKPSPSYSIEPSVLEFYHQTAVDILWVIDNSQSMDEYQWLVIQNTDRFMQKFTQNSLEWRMGLLSTSLREPPYLGFPPRNPILDWQTPNGITVFQRGVMALGTRGDSVEREFAPIQSALTQYPDFLRPEAALAVIMITDEEEQSGIPAASFVEFLLNLKNGDASRVFIYGAFEGNDIGCRSASHYQGSPFEEAVNLTHGKYYGICSPSFGENLADLAQDLITRISIFQIYLPARPIVKTIRVTYAGRTLPGGLKEEGGLWFYDYKTNTMNFYDLDFTIAGHDRVRIEFDEDVGR